MIEYCFFSKLYASIVLVVYLVYGLGTYYVEQTNQLAYRGMPNYFVFFMDMLAKNPIYAFSLLTQILSIILRGVIYFLVLKAISLGLNMIVETDINYREATKEEDVA